jgi:GNAT superfamily N-acetyltransferase
VEPHLELTITPRADLAGYERIDLDVGDVRVGHVRCRFTIEKVIIYHIQTFPEFQGNGYGRATIDMLKGRFQVLVADRVQYTARGFWEHMGFKELPDGNYEYRVP